MDNKKICVITGANSSIGYAIAESLQKDTNKQLVINARRHNRLEQLKTENVDVLTRDMLNTGFLQHLEHFVYDKCGRCDYLFNYVGIIHVGRISRLTILPKDYRTCYEYKNRRNIGFANDCQYL